jgi:hypothetical protein
MQNRLRNQDSIIVYSKDSTLRSEACEILREEGYTVYELTDVPATDFLISYDMKEKFGIPEEKYYQIWLRNTDAQVSVYEREGRISRLYGEAFSSGMSPEESGNTFLQANAELLRVDQGDLRYQTSQPIMYDQTTSQYKFTGLYYTQYKNDIPVFNTRLILLVKNIEGYPLVLASVDLRDLRGFNPLVTPSMLHPEKGIARAQKEIPSLINFAEPELVIWAGVDDMVVDPVVAYSFNADNGVPSDGSNPEKYLFVADAATGEILYKENMILFVDVNGNVRGKATQGKAADFCEEELPTLFKWARVSIGSTVVYTDRYGNFVIPNSGSLPVTVDSPIRGRWFAVTNQSGSNTILHMTVTPPGPANFMHNNLNVNEYYRAEVNGYVQANVVREFALTYNPSYPGLQQNEFPVKVNDYTGYCPGNAWYDGSSITFCRSGGGYPNTAWSTVIHHEYGHHLVAMAGSGQDEYGEGMGDVMGILITDDAGTGYGFYGDCGTPLRNADNTMQYPCSGEIHFCGQLLSGCVWSTRNQLYITNPTTYLSIISDLAVNAMLLHNGGGIDPSITIDYLTLDDDNGNIYDGTPHYQEIAIGFGAHNMDAPPLELLSFSFPNGLPDIISPAGGTTVRVVVSGVTQQPQPGTGKIYINSGSGWEQNSMTQIEPNVYDAVFPSVPCLTQVSYYFSAQTTGGQTQYWPSTAPQEYFSAIAASGMNEVFSDTFETDLGWTVQNNQYLSAGAWQRAVPACGGSRGEPGTDYDGSGKCFVTDNGCGDNDVDPEGAITWLTSPTFDLSTVDDVTIHYALWYTNDFGADPNNDLFKTYVSNDNGNTWVLAETIGPQSAGNLWVEHDFVVGNFVTLTNQIKVRFEASDLNAGSVVEAGIDEVTVTAYECGPVLSPDLSFVTLTNENLPHLVTCPAGDGPIYQHAKVTCKDTAGNPLAGIPSTAFTFTVNPTGIGTQWYGILRCTFTPVDPETDVNGDIRFTIAGDTSIAGNITIRVTVQGTMLNDHDTLICKTFDHTMDGVVSLGDFVMFAHDYGTTHWTSDYTGDGLVGLGDFSMFGQHYGH